MFQGGRSFLFLPQRALSALPLPANLDTKAAGILTSGGTSFAQAVQLVRPACAKLVPPLVGSPPPWWFAGNGSALRALWGRNRERPPPWNIESAHLRWHVGGASQWPSN